MAKGTYTIQELIEVEDEIREIAENLKKIRQSVVDANQPTVELDLGTFIFYSDWMKKWSAKNVGVVQAAMDAKKTRDKRRGNTKKS
jgi:hypothetical protein